MGNHPNVSIDKFPTQGTFLNQNVEVCFHYDTSRYIKGVIVRDDLEEPFLTIIKLENDKYILATECQYHPVD